MQSYTLARRIYTDLGLKRIALLRINEPLRPLRHSEISKTYRGGWAIRWSSSKSTCWGHGF